MTQPEKEGDQEQKIEHLQKENERLREQQNQLMSDYLNDLDVLSEHALFISKLRKELGEIKKLKEFYFNTSVMYYETLEFYADEANWIRHNTEKPYLLDGGYEQSEWEPSEIEFDGGKRARQVLEGEAHDA